MLQRSLVVLLSTLNLGAAAWWALHSPPQPRVEPAPIGVARLELLSEARRDATSGGIRREALSGKPSQCYSYGPFQDEQAIVAAQARLQGVALRLQSHREPLAPARQWRVMLPPLASASEAESTARRIAVADIRDYVVVTRGPDANAIALGMYSSEDAARTRVQELETAGFAARIEPWGPNMVTWLDVAGGADFDPIRAQALAGAAKRNKIDCDQLR